MHNPTHTPSPPLSRRDFVRGSAAAGAALATFGAPTFLRAADSPHERIRVGVMGVNGRGLQLSKEFAELEGAEVAYVCDVDRLALDKATAAVTEKQSRAPQAVADFRKILDDPAVDALVIAAPDHWHAPATILACAAGKHVYVEKPASHNPREGEFMLDAARKHQRVVQVGTQRRSGPAIREAIERVHRGEIGPVRFARCWINSTRPTIGRGQEVTPPSHLDYTLWQGPAPDRPYKDNLIHYNWHWFWNWGTGELGNNGVHGLDLARWGMQVTHPTRVVATGAKLFFDDDQETPDTQLATFHFGDKIITWEHRTWHKRGFEGSSFGAEFYGDNGALVIGSGDYAIFEMDGKERHRAPVTIGEIEHQQDFCDRIRDGGRPHCDVEDGVASALLCHLGNIAYRTGRTVQCDPATGRIRDDQEQMALWQREYRPGWEPQV
jgi:predicted dehydrogenase